MTKNEFLTQLKSKLNGLPEEDLNNRIEFYSEMIDDRIEEGKTEEAAVNEIGTVDKVVSQIASETPMLKLVKERVTPKRRIKAWEIVLIVLGFPLWFPLLLTAFILLLVGYILLWVLAIVAYAIELSFSASSVAAFILFIAGAATGNVNIGYLGASLILAGLSVFMFFGCVGATKVNLKLTKKIALAIKRKFVSRG